MYELLVFSLLIVFVSASPSPIAGTKCARNQVINRLTVYEDGALEAECGPIPCGEAGRRCIADQTSCRAETDVFSGMRWAPGGQSVLLRCCTLKTSNKIYVGTDLVTSGSYYQGGAVAKKDLYGNGGAEYDFIANVRTEQGGVRVWVYRIMCDVEEPVNHFVGPVQTAAESAKPKTPSFEKELEERQDEEEEEEEVVDDEEYEEENEKEDSAEEEKEEMKPVTAAPFNPLRYRPPSLHRQSTGIRRA